MQTYAYGYPRIGRNREYKRIIEGFWRDKLSEEDFYNGIDQLQQDIFATYENYVDNFPVGEMTLYDPMLDTAIMFGLYSFDNAHEYYELCRGKNALELTKWFNTNYHYLVPDFSSITQPNFSLSWNKPKEYFEKYNKGVPYLIGPFTFLKLSKGVSEYKFRDYLLALGERYRDVLQDFQQVHLDEPALVDEISRQEVKEIKEVYQLLGSTGCQINLFTYYDSADILTDLYETPIHALGLDFVNGNENLDTIIQHGFPEDKTLIAGLVNGRNVWRTNVKGAVATLEKLSRYTKIS